MVFAGGFLLGVLVGLAPVWAYVRRLRVKPGQALLVYGKGSEPQVYFTPTLVWPLRQRYEWMDISVHQIQLRLGGPDGVSCKDCIRADVKATYLIQVRPSPQDIVRVAQTIGVSRASDPAALGLLFDPKLTEALKIAFRKWDFEEITQNLEQIRSHSLELVGEDLCGFQLAGLSIHFEQTPMAALDRLNIMDAQGIRKIMERTTGSTAGESTETSHLQAGKEPSRRDDAGRAFSTGPEPRPSGPPPQSLHS